MTVNRRQKRMELLRFLGILIVLWTTSTPSWSSELPSTAELRRASFLIRGIPATTEEYAKVRGADSRQQLNNLVTTYLNSQDFVSRMDSQVAELFWLRVNYSSKDENGNLGTSDRKTFLSASVFRRIVEDTVNGNLPWDNLFLANQFKYNSDWYSPKSLSLIEEFYPQDFLTYDRQQLGHIAGKILTLPPEGEVEVNGEGSSTLAGLITTPEFFNRFADTISNVGRRRAAAIFRILLCDPMSPAVPINANAETQLLDLALADTPAISSKDGAQAKAADEHGSNPQCQACHYKLDPMAKTLRGNGTKLDKRSHDGTIRYRGDDNALVDISAEGISGVMSRLVQLPEYQRCQVRHFWNWYIGQDVPLTPEKMDRWAKVFNDVDRRPKDFIAALVKSPDFRTNASLVEGELITLPRVTETLERCNHCHAAMGFPSFTQNPIGGSVESHRSWLKRISKMLDFSGGGQKNLMPPRGQEWQLSKQEKALLFNWLAQGARNESGQPTLTAQDVADLAPPAQMEKPVIGEPMFGFGYKRILDADSLVSLGRLTNEATCFVDGQVVFGRREPRNGLFLSANATSALLQAAVKCARNIVITAVASRSYYPDSNIPNRISIFPDRSFSFVNRLPWQELTTEQKSALVGHLIHQLVGPDIVPNENKLVERLVDSANQEGQTEVLQMVVKIGGWIGFGVREFISL